MVDATDLKSVGPYKARAGSSPAIGNFWKAILEWKSSKLPLGLLRADTVHDFGGSGLHAL